MNCTGGVITLATGSGGVLVRGDLLRELILPFHDSPERVWEMIRLRGWCGEESRLSRELLERIRRYFSGEPVSFSDVPTDEEGITDFARRVREVVRMIPYGTVLTYGEVARRIGSSGAVRGVGRVMAANRHPLVIPCHRVVGSDGGLRGFSAPGGVASKGYLLALEGGFPPARSIMACSVRAVRQSLF